MDLSARFPFNNHATNSSGEWEKQAASESLNFSKEPRKDLSALFSIVFFSSFTFDSCDYFSGFMDAMRATSSVTDNKSGLRQADYLAIGISSALLGMLYIAGLIGFICYRRRRRQLENVHVKLAAGEELGVIRLNPLLDARMGQLNRSSPDNDLPGTRSSTRSSNRSSSQVWPRPSSLHYMNKAVSSVLRR